MSNFIMLSIDCVCNESYFMFTWTSPQIGVIIEDKEFVDSYMGGKPYKAGKFASSLRLSLWSEHLGLHAGEVVIC